MVKRLLTQPISDSPIVIREAVPQSYSAVVVMSSLVCCLAAVARAGGPTIGDAARLAASWVSPFIPNAATSAAAAVAPATKGALALALVWCNPLCISPALVTAFTEFCSCNLVWWHVAAAITVSGHSRAPKRCCFSAKKASKDLLADFSGIAIVHFYPFPDVILYMLSKVVASVMFRQLISFSSLPKDANGTAGGTSLHVATGQSARLRVARRVHFVFR